MKRLTLALLFFIFLMHDCLSQAKVMGIAEGRFSSDYSLSYPLFGATVFLEGTTIGAAADSTGFFSFEIPEEMDGTGTGGKDSLVVSFLGYQPAKVAIYFPVYEDIILMIELLDSTLIVSSNQGSIVGSAIRELPRPDYSVSTVYYATDRLSKTNSADPTDKYGVGRSQYIKYGFCRVSIPRDHRLGELEEASFWRMEFRNNPVKHIMVLETKAIPKESFFRTLRDSVRKSEEGIVSGNQKRAKPLFSFTATMSPSQMPPVGLPR